MKLVLLVVTVTVLSVAFASARTLDNLDPIVREMEIAKDVFRSSLSNSVSKEVRISKIEAQYLAQQGVLISIDIVRPWFSFNKSGQHITINADFEAMSEIPEVVQRIFADLEISVPPYDPEELHELRDLRAEQRELRKVERELRAKARVIRREMVRTDDTDIREELAEGIVDLERELKAVETEIDALNDDLDMQYQRMSEARSRQPTQDAKTDIDSAVAETACNYGDTFKSLESRDHLTVAIHQRNLSKYFVFEMKKIGECRRGDIDPGELLALSDVYEM